MKILVLGGAGYIGSHTCKALAAAGHEVLVYDNLSTGYIDFIRWGDFEHGDIRDGVRLGDVLANYKPDGVIHFAAKINVGESVQDPGKYFSNNVGGTITLLEAIKRYGNPALVVSSTAAVYGEPDKGLIVEESPKNPINPYGESKLFMEKMLLAYERASGLRWTSLRYFNAAGASADAEIGELHKPETHLIPRVIFASLGLIDKIDVFGEDYPTEDGSCVRDYIHVDDLARAHILAMERLLSGASCEAMNLGTAQGASVKEIIKGVERISKKKIPTHITKRRQGDPPYLVANAQKAKNLLGWSPEKKLDDILADAYRFHSKHNV